MLASGPDQKSAASSGVPISVWFDASTAANCHEGHLLQAGSNWVQGRCDTTNVALAGAVSRQAGHVQAIQIQTSTTLTLPLMVNGAIYLAILKVKSGGLETAIKKLSAPAIPNPISMMVVSEVGGNQ
jgi:hypothetical protein